ncbi:hypothetical protein [Neisseria dumasiana]|uniref:Uncharacterized protein n=1 Tax=Neisseria dumasiana TaxID=1931275 RepID=A0A1X3DIX9_9NEIS|nr:hypothetical protein [Neisseria dumasiana]OSI23164.1 hypothetical protein BV912_04345 [Neisseria dumasiana]
MKVEIAKQMTPKNGQWNSQFFKDAQFLDRQESEALIDFIEKVTRDVELVGKNKPSWQDDFGKDLLGATRYQILNCWHYHSGPRYRRMKFPVNTKKLAFNPNGDTSPEVIHYQKIDENTIFVQAFSPQHEPFPTANYSPNPILDRTFEQKIAALEQVLSEMDQVDNS